MTTTNMTPDFINLVLDMRSTQKEYFKTLSTESLRRSKELEKQVDKAIVQIKSGNPVAEQGRLI